MRSAALSLTSIRVLGGLGLPFFLAILAGCSPTAVRVSGTVTYKGQPLPGGLITFRPVDGQYNSVTADIDPQGQYSVDLPAGEVMVVIDNRRLGSGSEGGGETTLVIGPPPGVPLAPEMRAKLGGAPRAKAASESHPPSGPKSGPPSGPTSARRYVAIPAKYYTAETSGLNFTVSGKEQTQNFELTD